MTRKLFARAALFGGMILFTGCSLDTLSPSTPSARIAQDRTHNTVSSSHAVEDTRFQQVMSALVQRIKTNPNYQKIGLKTPEEKQWFKNLLYKLWHRDITREQFIAEGVKRYPDKRYEFTFIADAMQEI